MRENSCGQPFKSCNFEVSKTRSKLGWSFFRQPPKLHLQFLTPNIIARQYDDLCEIQSKGRATTLRPELASVVNRPTFDVSRVKSFLNLDSLLNYYDEYLITYRLRIFLLWLLLWWATDEPHLSTTQSAQRHLRVGLYTVSLYAVGLYTVGLYTV